MGQDKARLRVRGRSLLARSADAARELGLPVRVIRRDDGPRSGPVGGVCTALNRPRAAILLFLSCDMPRVQAGLLQRLLSRMGTRRQAAFVDAEGWVGFPFALRAQTRDAVHALHAQGQRSLQALAQELRAARLRLPRRDRAQLLNVNTPEAWQSFRTALAR